MEIIKFMQSNRCQYILTTVALGLSFLAVPANAESLKDILRYSLVRDPVLLEAQADTEGAYNRVEQSRSLHYPKVRLTGDSRLAERHKNKSNYDNSAITPGLEVSLNLYAFGAIDAEIAKNRFGQQYYQHKYEESREELGYTIGDLYLTAYDAKQGIRLLKKSLKRHQRILDNIGIIVGNDAGRRSEYVQAKARKILVNQQINDTQRLLDSSLSSLSKYTGKSISANSLQNPFTGLTQKVLKNRYTLSEEDRSPTFLAQQAELDSKIKDIEAEKAKQKPSIDLVGYATPKDQQIGLRFSWDVFNRSTNYTVKEKSSLKMAAESRLQRVIRDIEESSRLALLDMKRSEVQLKTLASQAKATSKVVDFYKLQFSVARRSLIEVLNAEKELTDVELAQLAAKTQWNRAALKYLRSQGKIAEWVGLSSAVPEREKIQMVKKLDEIEKPLKPQGLSDEDVLNEELPKTLLKPEPVVTKKAAKQAKNKAKEEVTKNIIDSGMADSEKLELVSLDEPFDTVEESGKKTATKKEKGFFAGLFNKLGFGNDDKEERKADEKLAVRESKVKESITNPLAIAENDKIDVPRTSKAKKEKKGFFARLFNKMGFGDDKEKSETSSSGKFVKSIKAQPKNDIVVLNHKFEVQPQGLKPIPTAEKIVAKSKSAKSTQLMGSNQELLAVKMPVHQEQKMTKVPIKKEAAGGLLSKAGVSNVTYGKKPAVQSDKLSKKAVKEPMPVKLTTLSKLADAQNTVDATKQQSVVKKEKIVKMVTKDKTLSARVKSKVQVVTKPAAENVMMSPSAKRRPINLIDEVDSTEHFVEEN